MTAADSVMMAVAELRRRIRGAGDEGRAAARPGVSIRTVIARGAAASVDRAAKHKLLSAAEKWVPVF
jgi:hypothetical protein